MDAGWVKVQEKTFTRWVNSFLMRRKLAVKELSNDLKNGINLINLLEILSNESLGKYDRQPRIKIQAIQNISRALAFIKQKGVKVVNIQAEDVHDGNLKLILGLIWTIIQRFQIEDISEDELNAKEALLLWCKKKTKGYRDCHIDDFHRSWNDGMAFLALLHAHRPNMINYDSLNKKDAKKNLDLAFDLYSKLNIARLLDSEDIVDNPKPDDKSIMAYVAQIYHLFASGKKGEVAGRRVGRLAGLEALLEKMKNDYNEKAKRLNDWMDENKPKMEDRTHNNTIDDVKAKLNELEKYKANEVPPKATDKMDLEGLFNSLALKLRSNNRPPFEPADGLTPAFLDDKWNKLSDEEKAREEWLRNELARLEALEALNNRFDDKASKLEAWIAAKDAYLKVNETVDSLREGETKLKKAEDFQDEYEVSKKRLKELQDLGADIIKLDAPNKDQVQQRLDTISNNHAALKPLHETKLQDLRDKVEKQRKMEELRKKFAELANKYVLWNKDAVGGADDRTFGDTLEDVEAFQPKLVKFEEDSLGQSKGFIDELKQVADEMEAMGVKHNPYTVFTIKDIDDAHKHLEEALQQRHKDYDAELERQRLMDAKRKEFAALAQQFVEHLDARQKTIDGMCSEPDPDVLVEQIQKEYAEGEPEKEKLKALTDLNQEMVKLGIRDNKYTDLTLPGLNNKAALFRNKLMKRIEFLKKEKDMKEEYIRKAKALVQWTTEKIPQLKFQFDNTLEGARKLYREFQAYKSSESAEKKVENTNLAALYEKISSLLKENSRPEFVPPQGLAVADVAGLFQQLETAEKEAEDEIKKELARHERIAKLLKQFAKESKEFEPWFAKKKEYLEKVETVENLTQARLQLKLLQAFEEDYSSNATQIEKLGGVVKEIESLNYNDTDSLKVTLNKIDEEHKNLQPLYEAKKNDLNEKLALQQKMEEMRQQYATLIKGYQKYAKEACQRIQDFPFGTTLEAVVAAEAELGKSDEKFHQESLEKKGAIDELSKSMVEIGIKENRFTTLTDADAAKFADDIENAIKERQKNYQEELQRQQAMEEKRKEWAAAADKFVEHLAERRKTIEALASNPDCTQLLELIKSTYNDGAEEKPMLEALNNLSSEMVKMDIRHNKHSSLTMPILLTRNKELATWVEYFEDAVNDEAEMKAEYENRTNQLLAWVEDTLPKMRYSFDNTLEGIKTAVTAWNQFKSGEIVEREIEKVSVEGLLQKIGKYLNAQKRPAWQVPDEISSATVAANFQKLHETTKEVDEEIQEELARQKKIADVVNGHNDAIADFESFISSKEDYLNKDETVATLNDARLAENLMKTNEDEINGAKPHMESILEVKKQIAEMNYHDVKTVEDATDAVEKRYNALFDLLKAKKERLEGALGDQLKKEKLRVAFANGAGDFATFVEDAVDDIKDYNFGQTLDAITQHKSVLENNTNEVKKKAGEKKAALDKLLQEMDQLGVKDNRHTTHNQESIENLNKQLETELDNRNKAYEEALNKESQFEVKRKEFAGKAAEFTKGISAKKASLKGLTGEPEKLAAEVASIYGEGKAEEEAINALSALAGEMQTMGIFTNPHTPYTVPSLQSYKKQFDNYVKNQLAAIEEERLRRERDEAAKKERQHREKIENMQIEFQQKARTLEVWFDKADDVVTDIINVNTVDEIKKISTSFSKFYDEIPQQKQLLTSLQQLAAEMQKEEIASGIDDINKRWEATNKTIEERKTLIADQVRLQEENEQLRVNFAKIAKAFKEFLVQQAKEAENVSGDSEKQLATLRKVVERLGAESKQLAAVKANADEMKKKRIKPEPHTNLTDQQLELEYHGLIDNTKKRYEVLEKDILMKQMGNVTPEQLKEFKEMFQHFDRDNKGFLTISQLKAVLSGLGEDIPESELKPLVDKNKNGTITFDEFLKFMINRTQDTDSKDQIMQAFKDLAGDKEFVTGDQLRDGMDKEKADYLIKVMPKYKDQPDCYDYMAWLNKTIK